MVRRPVVHVNDGERGEFQAVFGTMVAGMIQRIDPRRVGPPFGDNGTVQLEVGGGSTVVMAR